MQWTESGDKLLRVFPDGSHAQEFGNSDDTGQRLAALGASAPVGSMAGQGAGDPAPAPQTGTLMPGMTGLTSAAAASAFGELTTLAPAPGGVSLAQAPKITCPTCGTEQDYTKKGQTCKECGGKLEPATQAADETPFTGNAFSRPKIPDEFALNLADSSPDDEDVTGVGNDSVAPVHPSTVTCPDCGTVNAYDNATCSSCGAALLTAKQGLSVDQAADQAILHLSAEQLTGIDLADNAAQRQQWAKAGKALPDGSWPIPDVAYLKKAIQAFPGRAKGRVGKIKAWILKRAKELNYTGGDLQRVRSVSDGTNASQEPEHMATLQALRLDHTQGDGGLIWKVLCKTGTLALSPGPGQVDVEKPLNLTADLFKAVKSAYDDRAFEHVTIPETHGNGTLENTGTVDALDVLNKQQALADARLSQGTKDTFTQDPPDTLYMLGGLKFTDPKVREKAQNGSILNCSVGLKFNYRRKRDGKLFPVALEHTALTNQPWVDGLGAFGNVAMSGPFNQEELPTWDGVFTTVEKPLVSVDDPGNVPPSSTVPLSAPSSAGGLSSTMDPAETTPQTPSLEEVLAQQQATIERLERENLEARQSLGLSQTQINEQGRQLHNAHVDERVRTLQGMGVPPGVLMRYKSIALAAYDAKQSDSGTLQLSVKEGDSTVVKEFDPVGQAEYLLAAMPLATEGNNVYDMTQSVAADALSLTQAQTERKEQTAAEKADEIERGLHPERFSDDGKRISAAERNGKAA